MEPNQSRPSSPSGGRASPFRGKGFKSMSSKRFMRPVSCPESPRNVETVSSIDDSQNQSKPSVHFNIIPPVPRKRTAIRVIEAPTDDHDNRQTLEDISYQDRDMESFELISNERVRSSSVSRHGSLRRTKPLPAPRHHIQRSADDLHFTQPISNPRSYHKGFLGVVNGGSTAQPSKIPRRKSSVSTPNISRNNSISKTRRYSGISRSSDRLDHRRDSSSSPRRKTSNDLGGSMIDLGMGPSTLTSSRSINRISKPTTLSPIVGTPNKDCEQGSSHCRNGTTMKKCSNDSPTKIPVRTSSCSNVSSTSRESRRNSRETSPIKPKSPTKIPQKINSKNSSPSKGAKISNEKTGSTKSIPNSMNKESSSAKKEPAINREKSSVKKAPPATIKREPSALKRQPSTLKRENSQQKLKRENSKIGIGATQSIKQNTRRDPSLSTLSKNQSDSSLAKRLEKKNSFKQKRRTSSESDGLNEIDTANLSDKLIPLTKTNGISMTTAAVTSQPVQITAALTDQLSKKNSSGQIVNNDNPTINSDNNNNSISSSHLNDPNANAKVGNVDNIGDSTVDATGMTTAVIETNNQTDAVIDSKADNDKAATDANGNDTIKSESQAAVLEKKSSTRTLGGKSDTSNVLGTPIVPENTERKLIGTPIETKVNVIDMDNEALLMKPDDLFELNERTTKDANDMNSGMASDHRTVENLNVDNGVASPHMDQSGGADNHT